MNFKVSVIVPVYGVEKYIERCVRSLFSQTLEEVEYIFVNDATPDNSMDIIEHVMREYPDKTVRFLHHEVNRGLPAARNTGLIEAQGEYIYHCDSDDFTDPDMLEEMYRKAKDTNSDIVWCDLFLTYNNKERYLKQPCFNTPTEALAGILTGIMKYNVWNKFVRRSLYETSGIHFPAGFGMGEDMTIIKLMAKAKSVAYIPKAYYHYVKYNSDAFSNTYSDRHLSELRHNVEDVCKFLKYNSKITAKMLAAFLLEVKFPFLVSGQKRLHHVWQEWFPEANRHVGDNPNIGSRRKLLQMMAAANQWWFVNLYYILVYKIIYGRS